LAKNAETEFRVVAFGSLVALDKNYVELAVMCLRALEDRDPRVRGIAAWGIGQLRKDVDRCVPALFKAWEAERERGGTDESRSAILESLGQFRSAVREAIPLALKVARDPKESPRLRENAVDVLKSFGAEAKHALLKLTELDQRADPHEKRLASSAKTALF